MKHVATHHILTQLQSGTSTIEELAVELSASEEMLKPLIAELMSQGRIELARAVRTVRYKLVREKKSTKAREPLRTSMAGPIAPPPLKQNLSGYEAEMRERVELAMLGRGRQ
jgi:hypothetical protein